VQQYEEFVFPYHKRFVDEFSDGGHTAIHLCGNASRFFRVLKERLQVYSFDTGFPIDLGAVRRELGPDVQILGGPPVMLVRDGPISRLCEELRRICASGVMTGGRFVLIAANNMAPGTPVEHVAAMYEAAKQFGRYQP
jgi:uroporphyrinogen-III decarboxylase